LDFDPPTDAGMAPDKTRFGMIAHGRLHFRHIDRLVLPDGTDVGVKKDRQIMFAGERENLAEGQIVGSRGSP